MIILNGKQFTTPPDRSDPSSSIFLAMERSQEVFRFPTENALTFEMKLRNEIVQSAYSLSKSPVSFATFYRSFCNEEFWDLTDEGGFRLKNHAEPAKAIQDIFTNGGAYGFECATAMVIVLLNAVLKTIGAESFNRLYQSIYLWDWHNERHLPLTIQSVEGDGIPGDVRYFKNPQVDPETPQWQGENTIQLPDGTFYGHGVGIRQPEEIIRSLNRNRKPGADKSAYLLPRATRPAFQQIERLARVPMSI